MVVSPTGRFRLFGVGGMVYLLLAAGSMGDVYSVDAGCLDDGGTVYSQLAAGSLGEVFFVAGCWGVGVFSGCAFYKL